MNTKQYITKYNLSASDKFSHNEFISDFTNEFITLLEVGNSTNNFKGYENAVRAIRMKWDAISNKTVNGGLPDKLWSYFYATVIAKTKEELFPEQIARQKEINEKKRKDWEYRQEMRKEMRQNDDFFFWGFLFSGIQKIQKPTESYVVLGLDTEATTDDVKRKYRELSAIHHPDKGGNNEAFIKITEAKNKILASLN